jgi:hypothetical protein
MPIFLNVFVISEVEALKLVILIWLSLVNNKSSKAAGCRVSCVMSSHCLRRIHYLAVTGAEIEVLAETVEVVTEKGLEWRALGKLSHIVFIILKEFINLLNGRYTQNPAWHIRRTIVKLLEGCSKRNDCVDMISKELHELKILITAASHSKEGLRGSLWICYYTNFLYLEVSSDVRYKSRAVIPSLLLPVEVPVLFICLSVELKMLTRVETPRSSKPDIITLVGDIKGWRIFWIYHICLGRAHNCIIKEHRRSVWFLCTGIEG